MEYCPMLHLKIKSTGNSSLSLKLLAGKSAVDNFEEV